MSNESHADSVGYKQPPKAHQFRPGESGNPSGRPKGVRNFKTDLRDELSEMITFCESGQEVSISKQRAVIKRLVAAAIKGDARSIATLMAFCARAFGNDTDEQHQAPEDQQILDAFAPRPIKRRSKTAAATASSEE
jgi:antitoxin (DNA-binding transcriptional repressor) of toxin-antitoxin stability system